MTLYFYPLLAYLLGSIPFGVIFSNLFGKSNLRQTGSKNIGATNVLRTQGKLLGVLTFIMDFLKGFAACYFLRVDDEILNLMITAAPVLGHIFPVWLKFRGGKGVATYFGILYAINAFTFGSVLAIWLATFLAVKISSIAGLVSVFASLFIFGYVGHALCLDFINQLYVLIALVVLIFFRHKENMKRLLKKKELRA
ncbi:MAG: glycerol-3-phosphate 1-O-acyltransferase PlsY [Holosporaceae bacterium]|jgi:glycerol-3-phosphate acyltransferase PlsY|nr:glycerol-3-phosphate 1-O-acyltransferase PlsY [Holosporaceae bacterium]